MTYYTLLYPSMLPSSTSIIKLTQDYEYIAMIREKLIEISQIHQNSTLFPISL